VVPAKPPAGKEPPAPLKGPAAPTAPGGKTDGKNDDKRKDNAKPVIDEKAEIEAAWNRVIMDKISHAFLFQYKSGQHIDDPAKFELIGSSSLSNLVQATGDSGVPTAPTSSQAPAGAKAPGSLASGGRVPSGGGNAWSPLAAGGGAASGPGNRNPAGTGTDRRRNFKQGGGPAGAGSGPGSPSMGTPRGRAPEAPRTGPDPRQTPGSEDDEKNEKKVVGPTRTEFIMLFIWREPLPSEERGLGGK
jgi:hypothetical protein